MAWYFSRKSSIGSICSWFLWQSVVLFWLLNPPFIFGGHEYDENTLSGIFYSLLSALSIAGLYICLRKIGNDVHYTITSFYYSIIGFAFIGCIIWTTTGFNFICQVRSTEKERIKFNVTFNVRKALITFLEWTFLYSLVGSEWSCSDGITSAWTPARKSWSSWNFE